MHHQQTEENKNFDALLNAKSLKEIIDFFDQFYTDLNRSVLEKEKKKLSQTPNKNKTVSVIITSEEITEEFEKFKASLENLDEEKIKYLCELFLLAEKYFYHYHPNIDPEVIDPQKHIESSVRTKMQKKADQVGTKMSICAAGFAFVAESRRLEFTELSDEIENRITPYVERVKHILNSNLPNNNEVLMFLSSNQESMEKYDKFLSLMQKMRHKTNLMHYVEGEKKGKLTTRSGKTINSFNLLLSNAIEASKKEIHPHKDPLLIFEQSVLDTYYQVRKNQGMFDSRLADALENFINKELKLFEKYGLGCCPHKMNKDAKSPILGDRFTQKLTALEEILSDKKLKTKKRNLLDELLSTCRELSDQTNVTDAYKINKLIAEVAKTYSHCRSFAANDRIFGSQSNLADALAKFMKKELNIDMNKFLKANPEMIEEATQEMLNVAKL